MLGFFFGIQRHPVPIAIGIDEGLIDRFFIEYDVSNMEEKRETVFVFIVIVHAYANRTNRCVIN